MYVLLDWVANHTAWDNLLVEQHPEWYSRDWKGDLPTDSVVGLGGRDRSRLPAPGLRST